MVKKSNILKSGISLFLILAFFSFKVLDLHKYTHKNDTSKGTHCELCLLTQNHKNVLDLDLPVVYEFNIQEPFLRANTTLFHSEFKKVVKFPFGISLNKAPPFILV